MKSELGTLFLIKEDEIYDGSSSLVFDESYFYDKNGQLDTVYVNDTLSNSYIYNNYGWLTEENYKDEGTDYSYIYDKSGNRVKSNGDTLTYYKVTAGYNQKKTNRLKTAYSDSFAYNVDGLPIYVAGDDYQYNWNNRLDHIEVNDEYADHDFFYNYDYRNLRVMKKEKVVSGKPPFQTTTRTYTYYLYDKSGNLLCEYDGNGDMKRKYIYLPKAVIQITSSDTSYMHLDQRGSPVIVTDEGGNVIKRHRYYAFGDLRYQSGTFDTDYSFTGYLKEETGSHYAKMRYYSAGIGRFLRPDPAGGINPYLYCGNNPVNLVDPSGLSSEDAGGWYCWYNYTTGEWVYSGITVTGHYDYSGATNTAYSSYSVMMSQWAYEQLMEEGIGLETPFAGLPAIDDLRYYGGHGGGSGRSSSSSDSEGAGGEGGGGSTGGGGGLRITLSRCMMLVKYRDFNLTGGLGVGLTGGIIDKDDGFHLYMGFGLVGMLANASITYTLSSDKVSPGWNIAIQGVGVVSAQLGTHPYSWSGFGELGLGFPPGISITAFYVFPLVPNSE